MSARPTLRALTQHELTYRHNPSLSHGMARHPRIVFFVSAVIWVAVVTWQGPHVHFSMNDGWYATWALPFMALGEASSHTSREQKNGTLGWWLSLPAPRYYLLASKWMASIVVTIRQSSYLGAVAILGIYTMILNHTYSLSLMSHFLVTGIIWTLLMCCLLPPFAAVGILLGTLTFSRWTDLKIAVWALLIAAAGILIHPQLYLTVSPAMAVHVKPLFALAVAVTWLLGALIFQCSTLIMNRYTAF